MSNSTILSGMIIAMENMGAKFIKMDDSYVYFDIKKDSEIDDKEHINRAKNAFNKMFGVELKIRIKTNI